MDLQIWREDVDWLRFLEEDPQKGSCEHGSEPRGSIKGEYEWRFKLDSGPQSSLLSLL
jgi:hypothetical protein